MGCWDAGEHPVSEPSSHPGGMVLVFAEAQLQNSTAPRLCPNLRPINPGIFSAPAGRIGFEEFIGGMIAQMPGF